MNNVSGISLFKLPSIHVEREGCSRVPQEALARFIMTVPGSLAVLLWNCPAPSSSQTNLFLIPAFRFSTLWPFAFLSKATKASNPIWTLSYPNQPEARDRGVPCPASPVVLLCTEEHKGKNDGNHFCLVTKDFSPNDINICQRILENTCLTDVFKGCSLLVKPVSH